jgi:hypothetical protein
MKNDTCHYGTLLSRSGKMPNITSANDSGHTPSLQIGASLPFKIIMLTQTFVAFALIIWIQAETYFVQGVGWLQMFYNLYAIPMLIVALLPQTRYRYSKNACQILTCKTALS